jgi:hypothetical protein
MCDPRGRRGAVRFAFCFEQLLEETGAVTTDHIGTPVAEPSHNQIISFPVFLALRQSRTTVRCPVTGTRTSVGHGTKSLRNSWRNGEMALFCVLPDKGARARKQTLECEGMEDKN